MKRSAQNLALLLAGAMLLGPCAFRCAADEPKGADKPAPAESKDETKRWIDQLASQRFADRDQAKRALTKLGKSALPNLKEAANSRDAEVRRRAQQLVEQIEGPLIRPIDIHFEPTVPVFKSYL